MKRILIFNKVFFGISETFILRQAVALHAAFNVSFLARTFCNEDFFPSRTIDKVVFPTRLSLVDRFVTFVYRRVIDPELIISVATYFELLRRLRKGNFDAIHAHYGPNALKILPVAKRLKIPLIISFHGYDASRQMKDAKYIAALPELFEASAAIIVCARHMIDTLHLGPWISKVHHIPYGVDVNEFAPLQKNVATSKVVITHSGRIAFKKGVPDLIRVFSRLAEIHDAIELHILGDGAEAKLCRELVTEFSLEDKVKFYGAQPQNVVKQLLHRTDIFVLNSRVAEDGDMEGLPNTILEAMSLEKAVVSTIHAGIPDVIKDGENGFLVPERDNERLFKVLDFLISNPNARASVGTNARKTILGSFTLDKMGESLLAVFEKVLYSSD